MLLANVCAGLIRFCDAHWAEVGGGIVFVALWEFTGFHLNAPVAQRVITTEGSIVIGSVVKTI